MLTPTKNYKMSKQTKTMVANLWNHPDRGAIKRAMIQAELAEMIQPRREKRTEDAAQS